LKRKNESIAIKCKKSNIRDKLPHGGSHEDRDKALTEEMRRVAADKSRLVACYFVPAKQLGVNE
jgi:hypothetical protein